MRNDVINMSRAQDKEKTEFPIGTELRTFRPPVGCSNHWATKDSWRAGTEEGSCMTCVLRTARISNVEIVMRVIIKEIQCWFNETRNQNERTQFKCFQKLFKVYEKVWMTSVTRVLIESPSASNGESPVIGLRFTLLPVLSSTILISPSCPWYTASIRPLFTDFTSL